MNQEKINPVADAKLREIFNSLPLLAATGGHQAISAAAKEAAAIIAEEKKAQ